MCLSKNKSAEKVRHFSSFFFPLIRIRFTQNTQNTRVYFFARESSEGDQRRFSSVRGRSTSQRKRREKDAREKKGDADTRGRRRRDVWRSEFCDESNAKSLRRDDTGGGGALGARASDGASSSSCCSFVRERVSIIIYPVTPKTLAPRASTMSKKIGAGAHADAVASSSLSARAKRRHVGEMEHFWRRALSEETACGWAFCLPEFTAGIFIGAVIATLCHRGGQVKSLPGSPIRLSRERTPGALSA